MEMFYSSKKPNLYCTKFWCVLFNLLLANILNLAGEQSAS